jgi:hypothetical protein
MKHYRVSYERDESERAIRVLRTGKLKMNARDAARLPRLSHQRVHQLTQIEAED